MTNIAPEVAEERPAIQDGDVVELYLGGGITILGTLIKTMSGEGQTDGLLKINEDVTGSVVFVYERHIRTIRRLTVDEDGDPAPFVTAGWDVGAA